MTKIKIHINEPVPSPETIKKYKNYNYRHSGPTKFVNYQGLHRIFFKKRRMMIAFIMILVTLLVLYLS